jgi:hypothetical protein
MSRFTITPRRWFFAASAAGLALVSVRWIFQGSGNLYSDFDKQLYVPDPDLAWRLTDGGPIWLGLDAIGFAIAIGFALVVGERLLRGRDTSLSSLLSKGVRAAALVPFFLGLVAFATGQRPVGARDVLPTGELATISTGTFDASLRSVPAGGYQVIEHAGTHITATLEAGGERFEARFTGAPKGVLRFDPTDLRQPMSANISFASASVDTGIDLRSKHAREELRSEDFPRIGFRLEKILGVEQESETSLAFAAQGIIELMGREHIVDVQGVIREPDPDGLRRLGLDGENAVVIQAQTQLLFSEIAVDNDGTFESDSLPIQVSLVMTRRPTS